MKIKLDEIPAVLEGPNTIMRRLSNLGDMDVTYSELPKGTDFGPLLKGLSNDSCSCPHWGYLIEGTFKIIYDDGTEDVDSLQVAWVLQSLRVEMSPLRDELENWGRSHDSDPIA